MVNSGLTATVQAVRARGADNVHYKLSDPATASITIINGFRPKPSRLDVPDDAAAEETMRKYVSGLWAEDWNSPEDAIYD